MRYARLIGLLFALCSAAQGEEQVLRLDFGPATSACARGYVRVSPTDVFQPKQGVGWLENAGLMAWTCKPQTLVDRRGAFGFRQAPEVLLDDVTRDFVLGQRTAVLAVSPRFAPSWMGIVAGVGCAVSDLRVPPILDVAIAVNGQPLDAFTIPQAGMFVFRTLQVPDDKLLQITFSSPHMAWAVNAVILASEEGRPAAEAELDALRQATEFLPTDEMARWRSVPPPAMPQGIHNMSQGYALVARSPTCDFSQPPGLDRAGHKLRCFATAGETEPLAFALVTKRPLSGVEVSASRLAEATGGLIPSDHVIVRTVRCWPRKIIRCRQLDRGQYVQLPELLEPCRRVDIAANSVVNFYIDIQVPPEARPGYYLGRIVVAPANAPRRELAVELRVMPFLLPERAKPWVGIQYDPPSAWAERYRATPYYEELTERLGAREALEVADMLAHGVNGMAVQTGIRRAQGKVQIDRARLAQVLKLCRLHRLREPLVVKLDVEPLLASFGQQLYRPDLSPPSPPGGFDDALRQAVRSIDALAREAGVGRVVYWLHDYAECDAALRPFIARMLAALEPAAGDRLLASGGEELIPFVDLYTWARCYNMPATLAAPFAERGLAAELGRSRKKLWLATHDLALGEGVQPARARFEAGFFAYKHRTAGILLGEYQGQQGNPLNAFDALDRGEGFTFPDADGPAPTLVWEGVREAVDDLRYARALEALIAATKNNPKASVYSTARQADRDLRRLIETVPSRADFLAKVETSPCDAAQDLSRLRWRMASWLDRLTQIVAGRVRRVATRGKPDVAIECVPRVQPRLPPRRRRSARVPMAAQPPTIDGKLDDACWQTAPKLGGFVDAQFGTPTGPDTLLQVCADAQRLYLAFTCQTTEAERTRAIRFGPQAADRPLWWTPSMHVFLAPGNGRRSCFQIGVGRSGALLDRRAAPLPNIDWTSEAQAATASDGKSWTAELAVPRPAGDGGASNCFWGFNAARRVMDPSPRWLVWSAAGPEPCAPDRLGRLVFESAPCYIADVGMAPPYVGINRYIVKLVNPGPDALAARLTAILNHSSGRPERADFKVPLEPKGTWTYTLLQRIKRAGRASLALALYPATGQPACSVALRSGFAVEPTVRLELAPPYCLVGEPVRGTMTLRVSRKERQDAQVKLSIRRSPSRKPLRTDAFEPSSVGNYSLSLPTARLRPGRYELEAKVVVAGKTKATDKFEFVVFEGF